MPFYYTISSVLNLVYVHANGNLVPDGLKRCVEGYMLDPAFRKGMNMLVEVDADADVRFVDAETFEHLHRMVRTSRGDTAYRVACVSPVREVVDALFAIAEESPAQVEAEAFGSTTKAFAWLGIEPDDEEELLGSLRAEARAGEDV